MGQQTSKLKERVLEEAADRLANNIWVFVPFVVLIATWAFSHPLAMLFSDHAVMWSVLLHISTVALMAEQFLAGKGTRLKRGVRTLMVGFIGHWTAEAIIWGSTGLMGQIWLFALITIAPAVAIVSHLGDDVEDSDGRTDRFTRRFDKIKEAWGHANTKIKKLPVVLRKDGTPNPHKTEYEFEVDDIHQNSDDAMALRKKIAAKEHTSLDQVIIRPDPKDYHKAIGTIIKGDIENQPLPWTGPSIPQGGSIKDPIQLGLRIDGENAAMKIVDMHAQVMGMTGSGKSFGFLWNFFAEVITRYSKAGRTEFWGVDLSKGRQTFGPMEQAIDKLVLEEEDAKQMVLDLLPEIKNRMNILTDEGFKSWHPSSSLRYRIIYFEEAPAFFKLFEDDIDLHGSDLRLWKEARSAGISLVTSLQIATHGEQPKSVLRQITNKVCFGVGDSGDADYGLNSVAIRNGADPSRWAGFNPGMCYMSVNGIPQNEWHTPVRTYLMTQEQMVRHCNEHPAPGKEDWVVTKGKNAEGEDEWFAVSADKYEADEDGITGGVTYERADEAPKQVDDDIDGVPTSVVFEDPEDQESATKWDKEMNDHLESVGLEEAMRELESKPAKRTARMGSLDDVPEGTARERILKVLDAYKAKGIRVMSAGSFVEETKCQRSTVSTALGKLADEGILSRAAHGKYSFGPNYGKIV